MKPFTNAGPRAPWLAGCILLLASVLGVAGSASATSLLFVPESGTFPYRLAGQPNGRFVLLTLGGNQFLTFFTDALASVVSSTVFELHLLFLASDIVGGGAGSSCGNSLANLLGSFGLADPGGHPAGLLLFPSGYAIKCQNGTVLVKGSAIGLVSTPAPGSASELLDFSFKQTNGNQEFTSFLLSDGTLMSNQLLLTAIHGGLIGNGKFERSAIQIETLPLKSLSGEGQFTLVSDP